MKILHVINTLDVGGAEVLLVNLLPHLRRSGVEPSLYALSLSGTPLQHDLIAQGVPLFGTIGQSIYSPNQVLDLKAHLQRHHYDAIHVHLFPAQLWVPMAVALSGRHIPLITTEHSTSNRRRKALFRPIDRWLYSRYRIITCITEAVEHDLIEWVPTADGRTAVVANGISTVRFQTARAASKERIIGQTDRPVVMFVARFEAQKDHATLLRAMCGVPEAALVLVGDGSLRTDCEALARDLGIAHRVHFLGARTDVPALLKMADVYVQSSHWEGFGLSALEAMAAGVPVIASNVPGLADLVGNAGLTFPAGNSAALAAHIRTLLHDQQLRGELGAEAKRRAAQYSIDNAAARYAALYENAVFRKQEAEARA